MSTAAKLSFWQSLASLIILLKTAKAMTDQERMSNPQSREQWGHMTMNAACVGYGLDARTQRDINGQPSKIQIVGEV